MTYRNAYAGKNEQKHATTTDCFKTVRVDEVMQPLPPGEISSVNRHKTQHIVVRLRIVEKIIQILKISIKI